MFNVEKEYLINEIAKMYNITKRTLQYYDKINLLKPSFIKENGYRVYKDDELTKLIEIIILKNLGLDSPDIKSYFDQKTPESINNILNNVDNRLDNELKKILFMKENIKLIKDSLNYENSAYAGIKIKTFEVRKIIKIKDSGESIKNIIEMMTLGIKVLNKAIENLIPFIEFGFIFSNDSKQNDDYTKYSNYFFTLPKNYEYDNSINLNNGIFACSWFEGNLRELDKDIKKILVWIDKNDYVIDGDIIYSESLSSLCYSAAYMSNGEIQIAIRHNKKHTNR